MILFALGGVAGTAAFLAVLHAFACERACGLSFARAFRTAAVASFLGLLAAMGFFLLQSEVGSAPGSGTWLLVVGLPAALVGVLIQVLIIAGLNWRSRERRWRLLWVTALVGSLLTVPTVVVLAFGLILAASG